MRLETVESQSPAPLNLTDEELVAHIRFYYPNLQGPLKMMLDRFSGKAFAQDCDQCEPNMKSEQCGHCPSCNSLLRIASTE